MSDPRKNLLLYALILVMVSAVALLSAYVNPAGRSLGARGGDVGRQQLRVAQ